MSTGFAGAESGKIRIGDTVAVFAQGPIGLCSSVGARLMGATKIIAVETVPERIEMAKRKTEELRINPPSKVHVEHIYPQKPLEGQRWTTHDRFIDRLGNLSLLDKRINSAIRNGGFAAKKAHYAESEIIITSDLSALEDWTEERIAVRQEAFAAMAPALWPITKL